jgi:hypothetical protein
VRTDTEAGGMLTPQMRDMAADSASGASVGTDTIRTDTIRADTTRADADTVRADSTLTPGELS